MINLNKINLLCPYCNSKWSFHSKFAAMCDECMVKAKNPNINGFFQEIYIDNHAYLPTFQACTIRLRPNTIYLFNKKFAEAWELLLSFNIPFGTINPSNIKDWEAKINKVKAFL